MVVFRLQELEVAEVGDELWLHVELSGVKQFVHLEVLRRSGALSISIEERKRIKMLHDPRAWADESIKIIRVRVGEQFEPNQFAIAVKVGVKKIEFHKKAATQTPIAAVPPDDERWKHPPDGQEVVDLECFDEILLYGFLQKELAGWLEVREGTVNLWRRHHKRGRTKIFCGSPGVARKLVVMHQALTIMSSGGWWSDDVLAWWRSEDSLEVLPVDMLKKGEYERLLDTARRAAATVLVADESL